MPRPTLHTFACLLTLALLACTGCSSTNLRARSLPSEYRATPTAGQHRIQLRGIASSGVASAAIGAGDLLEVTVTSGRGGEAVDPVMARVSDDGLVEAPYIGPVRVLGVEPTVAAARITSAAIERGVYVRPQVNVVIAEQATYKITVLGAVTEPGVKEVPRSACDILAAVAHAGGFTEEAGTVVEVLRHDAQVLALSEGGDPAIQQVAFDAPALTPQGAPSGGAGGMVEIDLAKVDSTRPSTLGLSDRDVVVVRPKEKRLVHVTGLVKEPQQFELSDDQDLRVLDAIAMSGGVTSPVADKVIVIRHVDTQPQPIVAEVSLQKAKQDGAENLVLQAGDLISVERTVATAVVDTFKDLFRITMGVGRNLTIF